MEKESAFQRLMREGFEIVGGIDINGPSWKGDFFQPFFVLKNDRLRSGVPSQLHEFREKVFREKGGNSYGLTVLACNNRGPIRSKTLHHLIKKVTANVRLIAEHEKCSVAFIRNCFEPGLDGRTEAALPIPVFNDCEIEFLEFSSHQRSFRSDNNDQTVRPTREGFVGELPNEACRSELQELLWPAEPF